MGHKSYLNSSDNYSVVMAQQRLEIWLENLTNFTEDNSFLSTTSAKFHYHFSSIFEQRFLFPVYKVFKLLNVINEVILTQVHPSNNLQNFTFLNQWCRKMITWKLNVYFHLSQLQSKDIPVISEVEFNMAIRFKTSLHFHQHSLFLFSALWI